MIAPFLVFISTGSELGLELGPQSSTEKILYYGQRPYITEKYSVNAIFLLIYNECRIKRKAVIDLFIKRSNILLTRRMMMPLVNQRPVWFIFLN